MLLLFWRNGLSSSGAAMVNGRGRSSLAAARAATHTAASRAISRFVASGVHGGLSPSRLVAFSRSAPSSRRGASSVAAMRATGVEILTARATELQFTLAASDVSAGGWTNELGSAVNLYASIDEATASDVDYVQSSPSPLVVDETTIRLAGVAYPGVTFDHTLRYRYRKNTNGGDHLSLEVRLYRADGVTVIASQTHADIDTVTDAVLRLTEAEVATIPSMDYSSGLVLGLRAVVSGAVAPPGVTDSFDRADDAASLGTTESGQVWVPLAGVWGIVGNQAKVVAGGSPKLAVVESGLSDTIIQVTLSPTDSGQFITAGVAVRVQDTNNLLRVTLAPEDSLLRLARVGGSGSAILASVGFTTAASVVLRVECVGTTIRCYVNDALRITTTGVTDFLTATQHGLYAFGDSTNADATWDNFSVVVP